MEKSILNIIKNKKVNLTEEDILNRLLDKFRWPKKYPWEQPSVEAILENGDKHQDFFDTDAPLARSSCAEFPDCDRFQDEGSCSEKCFEYNKRSFEKEEDLRRCDCGYEGDPEIAHATYAFWVVRCRDCGCLSHRGSSKSSAVDSWEKNKLQREPGYNSTVDYSQEFAEMSEVSFDNVVINTSTGHDFVNRTDENTDSAWDIRDTFFTAPFPNTYGNSVNYIY